MVKCVMSKINYTKEWVDRIFDMYLTEDIKQTRKSVISNLSLHNGDRVLDIGCGTGFLVNDINSQNIQELAITGIDISPDMVQIAKEHFPDMDFKVADATELPFKDNSIDKVSSMQTFAYIDNYQRAMKEVFRVLKPGGRFVLLDTDYASAMFYNNNQSLSDRAWEGYIPHANLSYVNKTFRKSLSGSGFNVVDVVAHPIVNISYNESKFGYHMANFVGSYLFNNKIFTEKDLQEWKKDLEESDTQNNYFFSLTRFIYICEKH